METKCQSAIELYDLVHQALYEGSRPRIVACCQDLGPDKLYSMLRSMTHQSSICAFWLWPGGKLSDHQAVGLRSSTLLDLIRRCHPARDLIFLITTVDSI